MRSIWIFFYSFRRINTGNIWEIEIHQDQVGFFEFRLFYGLGPIRGLNCVVAAKTIKKSNENRARVITVFNYQDSFAHCFSAPMSRAVQQPSFFTLASCVEKRREV